MPMKTTHEKYLLIRSIVRVIIVLLLVGADINWTIHGVDRGDMSRIVLCIISMAGFTFLVAREIWRICQICKGRGEELEADGKLR